MNNVAYNLKKIKCGVMKVELGRKTKEEKIT